MPRKERQTLMTNSDPRQTINTLCEMKDIPITYTTYKKKYEELYNDGVSISRQHNDAHFYLLRQFQLIYKVESIQYAISATGREICKLLSKHEIAKYQDALKTVLLSTENRDFFEQFLEFTKRSKSLKEIKERFGKIVSDGEEQNVEMYRTLIAWSEEANLITKHTSKKDKTSKIVETYVASTPQIPQTFTMEEFWHELKRIYKEIQNASGFGSKMFYVSIGELRLRVSVQLGFLRTVEFDYYLTNLLEDKKYRLYIRLHGAPSHAYDIMESFEFDKKKYPLLSLVGDE